jgi:excisionase family DNA binding protein
MKLLTVREVCERLRISRATFYSLVKKGDLSIVKIGGKSLIAEDVIERLVTRGTRKSAPRRVRSQDRGGWKASWEAMVRQTPQEPSGPRPFYAPRDAGAEPGKIDPEPAAATENEKSEEQ